MHTSKWIIFGASFLAGAVLSTIHPPFSITVLPFFSLTFIYWLLRISKQAKLIGFGFGVGYFGVMMSWLFQPFIVRTDIPDILGIFSVLAMAIGGGVFYSFAFRLWRNGPLILTANIMLIALLMGSIFTGLPWGVFGDALLDTPLSQGASLIGSYGLMATVTYLFLSLSSNYRHLIPALIINIALILYGVTRAEPENYEFANIEIGIVQANIPQADALSAEQAAEGFFKTVEMSKLDVDLIIWPEAATQYSPSYNDDMLKILQEELGDVPILVGATHWEQDTLFNSAFLIKKGEIISRYDKSHLVPFGEYIPFSQQFDQMGLPIAAMTGLIISSGEAIPIEAHDELPQFGVLICYEGIFPMESRRDGAFIALITNDSWFITSNTIPFELGGPEQHLAAARMRAIEQGKPIMRSSKTGISAVISAKGELLSSIEINKAGTIAHEIGPKYNDTVFNRVGTWPVWIFAILGVSLSVLSSRKSGRKIAEQIDK